MNLCSDMSSLLPAELTEVWRMTFSRLNWLSRNWKPKAMCSLDRTGYEGNYIYRTKRMRLPAKEGASSYLVTKRVPSICNMR